MKQKIERKQETDTNARVGEVPVIPAVIDSHRVDPEFLSFMTKLSKKPGGVARCLGGVLA